MIWIDWMMHFFERPKGFIKEKKNFCSFFEFDMAPNNEHKIKIYFQVNSSKSNQLVDLMPGANERS